MASLSAGERRRAVHEILRAADGPVSAAALARRFSVSRQIIVGDVALLRAGGADISATPRGYLAGRGEAGVTGSVACVHTPEQMGAELTAIGRDRGAPGLRTAYRRAAPALPVRRGGISAPGGGTRGKAVVRADRRDPPAHHPLSGRRYLPKGNQSLGKSGVFAQDAVI